MVYNVYFPIFLHRGQDRVRELWVLVVGHGWLLLLVTWEGGHRPFLAVPHFFNFEIFPSSTVQIHVQWTQVFRCYILYLKGVHYHKWFSNRLRQFSFSLIPSKSWKGETMPLHVFNFSVTRMIKISKISYTSDKCSHPLVMERHQKQTGIVWISWTVTLLDGKFSNLNH